MPLVEKHAPLKKSTVRNTITPWFDKEIKDAMKNERSNGKKKTAIITGNKCDWDLCRKLRNSVIKTSQEKKEFILKIELKR